MQTIFEYEFLSSMDRKGLKAAKLEPEKLLKYNLRHIGEKLSDTSFAEQTLKGILARKKKILKIIQETAPEWPVDKIAPVDRAILEIGVFEIVYADDIPPVVAINEAIEIAKTYGDTNSPKFINGVLSSVMTKYKKNNLKVKNEQIRKT